VEGRAVKRGELLAMLNADDIRAEVARLREQLVTAQETLRAARAGGPADEIAKVEADIRQTEADVARLRKERDSLERLLAKQAATQQELDQTKLALAKAEENLRVQQQKRAELRRSAGVNVERGALQLEQTRAALRAAEEKLASARVTAPAAGTLYALPLRPGQFVRVGELLAELADLKRVQVRAFVDEPELGMLGAGQAVQITWDAMPGHTWQGRVEQVPKAVVARGNRSVGEVLLSVENDEGALLPNTNVDVRISVQQHQNALAVPRAAVRSEGAERYVFVLDGDTLRRRTVKVGIASTTQYEILQGLNEGDRVALPGDATLRDGMSVRVAEEI
jgi:HlyD family secretion protein